MTGCSNSLPLECSQYSTIKNPHYFPVKPPLNMHFFVSTTSVSCSLSFTRIYSAFDFTLKIRLNRENIKIHPSFCNCKFWGYQKLHFCHQIKILWHLAWTSWDQSSKTKDKKSRRKVGRFWLCLPSLREIWVQTSWTQKDLNWFSSSREDVLCLQMKKTQGHRTCFSGSLLSDLSRRSSPLC